MWLRVGALVMLKEFDNGETICPRQPAKVLGIDVVSDIVTVQVPPEFDGDDGLREITQDQIEGHGGKA